MIQLIPDGQNQVVLLSFFFHADFNHAVKIDVTHLNMMSERSTIIFKS